MGKQPAEEPRTRLTITLSDAMWAEIEAVKRATPGATTKMKAVRLLLREALAARAENAGGRFPAAVLTKPTIAD